jgi:tRNA 2-thiouridine synthesizing protein C
MTKSILLLNSKAPYGQATALETLDLLLAASSFFKKISALFYDDGVFQLITQQHLPPQEVKNIAVQLTSLPHYDVAPIFVNENDLSLRGLTKADLIMPVQLVSNDDIKKLFTTFDVVIGL